MLVGEDRRRRQDRDLQAVVDRLERRPHRDFRLAEADVATQQAVHRTVAGQVLLDRPHRLQLIGRFLIGEGALELELAVAVRAHGHRLREPALGVELQQVGGDRLETAPDPALLLRPATAAQLVQTRRDAVDAAVALDLVQARARQEQGPPRRVEKLHHFDRARLLLPPRVAGNRRSLAGRTVERLEPQELPDAVIFVDHELADAQVAQAGDKGTHPAAAATRGEPLAEELTLAVEHQTRVRQPEAPPQLAVDQTHRAAVPVDLAAAQRLAERLVPFRARHQPEVVASRGGRFHFARETGKLIDQHVRLGGAEVDPRAPLSRSRVQRPADPERRPLHELQHLVRRHRQSLRFGHDLAVVATPCVLLPQQPGMLLDFTAHPFGIDHDHRRIRHHFAEARARLEQGQVLLPAVEGLPRRHLLQLSPGPVRQVAVPFFHQQRRQANRLLRAGDEGRQGPDPQRLDRLFGTLGGRIEAVDALDRVAEQVETRRSGLAGREEIEHAAALRHRADRRHEIAPPVAVGQQTRQQILGRRLTADLEFDDRPEEGVRPRQAVEQGPRRANHGDSRSPEQGIVGRAFLRAHEQRRLRLLVGRQRRRREGDEPGPVRPTQQSRGLGPGQDLVLARHDDELRPLPVLRQQFEDDRRRPHRQTDDGSPLRVSQLAIVPAAANAAAQFTPRGHRSGSRSQSSVCGRTTTVSPGLTRPSSSRANRSSTTGSSWSNSTLRRSRSTRSRVSARSISSSASRSASSANPE